MKKFNRWKNYSEKEIEEIKEKCISALKKKTDPKEIKKLEYEISNGVAPIHAMALIGLGMLLVVIILINVILLGKQRANRETYFIKSYQTLDVQDQVKVRKFVQELQKSR